MENVSFKDHFNELASSHSFGQIGAGWFRESVECIVVLELQKSNFGNYYELNLKVFVHGLFGMIYSLNKSLVTKEMGDVFVRAPKSFRDVFDLDNGMNSSLRFERLETLFGDFISPLSDKALTKTGVLSLEKENGIYLLPAVKENLLGFVG